MAATRQNKAMKPPSSSPTASEVPPPPELDLSHLTEEEREQIQAVLQRQKQEEDKEARIFEALKEEISKAEETVKAKCEETKQTSTQNGAICEICHKTKFADGVGHSCSYCGLKSCARCGGRVTLRSSKVLWVCKLCRKKQELLTKTGKWYHGSHATPEKLPLDQIPPAPRSQPTTPGQGGPSERPSQGRRGSDRERDRERFDSQGRGPQRSNSSHVPLTRQLSKSEDDRNLHRPQSREGLHHSPTRGSRHDLSREQRDIREPRGEGREGPRGEGREGRELRDPRDIRERDPQYHSSARDYERSRERGRYRDRPPERDRSGSGDRYAVSDRPERSSNYAGRGRPSRAEHERFSDRERDRRFSEQEHTLDRYEEERFRQRFPDRDFEERFYIEDPDRQYEKQPVSRTSSGRSLDRQRRFDDQSEFSNQYPDASLRTSRDSLSRREGARTPSDLREYEGRERRNHREFDRAIVERGHSPSREKDVHSNENGTQSVQYKKQSMQQGNHFQGSPTKKPRAVNQRHAGDSLPDSRETHDSYITPSTEPLNRHHLDPSTAAATKVTTNNKQESRKNESMIRNDSLSSDQSECVRPPPPKPHKGKVMRKRRDYSLSSSEEEIRSTPDYTSADEGEVESGSISERGEPDNWDERTPSRVHASLSLNPVTWQRDVQNGCLIGRMVLRKNPVEAGTPQDSSAILGLKVVGGKRKEAGNLGAFISRVKRGSIADTVGHLRQGDEVLSWNGHDLQGKDFNEVYNIIYESKAEAQVELVVARPMGSEMGQSSREKVAQQFRSTRPDSMNKRSSQSSSGYESPSKPREDDDPVPHHVRVKRPSVTVTSPGSPGLPRRGHSPILAGEIQIKLWYDSNNYGVNVTLHGVQGLQPRDNGEYRNPYMKMFLLPDRSEETKRRTKPVVNTLTPKWNQTFTYGPLKRSEFRGRELEVTIWDFEHYGAKEFLGEVLIPLDHAPFDDEPHWYNLYSHRPMKQESIRGRSKSPISKDSPRDELSPGSGGRITDSDISDFDEGINGITGSVNNLGGTGDGASLSSFGSSCSPPPVSEDDPQVPDQEFISMPHRKTGIVTPPPPEELANNERQRRNSQSTLAVPDRVPRRSRSPSPSRRDRHRNSEPSVEGFRQERRDSYEPYSPPDASRNKRSESPPIRDLSNRTFSPPHYKYEDTRRSRSPNRRSEIAVQDSHRRSRSEVRGEMAYDRQYRSKSGRAGMRGPNDTGSLPNTPYRGDRDSPSSTPSTPRKHRQLPVVPASLSRGDKVTAELEERTRQMKLKMKVNQYKQAANTLSPHGGVERPIIPSDTSPSRSHSRKQSPDNISLKSSDSNVSSTSDVSAVTQASMSSAFSTQSERPKHTRKLSAFTAKMQEHAPNQRRQLNRSTSSNDMYLYEKNEGSISDSAAEPGFDGKKRRGSIAKVASLVGLSKKSSSTSNLSGSGKKPQRGIQRTEEVGIHMAVEARDRLQKQASRESNDGSVCSFGSDGSSGMMFPSAFHLGPDGQFGEFLEGLGPSQLVGRQVLGSPVLGDMQIGLEEKQGRLEVEIIRARGLLAKSGSKLLPAPYVKVYLMEGKNCIGKKKTKVARRTLDPLYQQVLVFEEDHRGKILQVTVWGDYGRMDRKVFMGVAQILLDDLDLSSPVIGWYKLFNASSLVDMHHRTSTSSLEGSMTSLTSSK
ncbi:Regulating synaptic membrane exocytosis protein 2 [Holothuria leucospilota]|uniref:Regulating synaptic membrane exocytosis protein 2 n=1 Tax=Holothuria leucospilota TaxID=206669 RepID=A0A9Q1BA61_HOLLE|nr:Regulating synaptic membrane exocytosis protein 2 [Holothuria leucospilota]